MDYKKIPIEISARHLHLSKKDLAKLFGRGAKLHQLKKLSQASEFAAKETVLIKNGKNFFKNVRVVGPEREKSQIEITKTEARFLKINPPIRVSGDILGAPCLDVIGPKGKAKIPAIIAQRHLHLPSALNKFFKKNKVSLSVLSKSRSLVFHDIAVRRAKDFSLAVHLDTDEANAAGLESCSWGKLEK